MRSKPSGTSQATGRREAFSAVGTAPSHQDCLAPHLIPIVLCLQSCSASLGQVETTKHSPYVLSWQRPFCNFASLESGVVSLRKIQAERRSNRAWRSDSAATPSSPVASELPTMSTPRIYVCGVPELESAFSNTFTHVISIWDPEWIDRGGVEHQLKKRLAEETRLHIAYFHDCSVEEPGRTLPAENDLRQILAFAADLKPEAHVLIHCWAGISRSTAVAYAILCQFMGPGRESECIEAILAVRPQAFPNTLIVDLADRILERHGAMRQACDKLISRVYLHSAVDDEL